MIVLENIWPNRAKKPDLYAYPTVTLPPKPEVKRKDKNQVSKCFGKEITCVMMKLLL